MFYAQNKNRFVSSHNKPSSGVINIKKNFMSTAKLTYLFLFRGKEAFERAKVKQTLAADAIAVHVSATGYARLPVLKFLLAGIIT